MPGRGARLPPDPAASFEIPGGLLFFQKQYAEGRDLLLWYVNLQPEAANRALVLAKIAETFSAQDEPDFANKLYDHIQSYYPNSEGDIIAQIRRAELLKNKGKLAPEDDLTFFRELAQKSLPLQLTKLIHLKLASREHEYGNFDESLSVIDYNLQESMQGSSNEDFLALRPKVITDWVKSAYQNHDYGTVIMLYENNLNAFADAGTVAFKRMIADSYAGLKQYQKAFALFEQILAKEGPASEGKLLIMMAETAFSGHTWPARKTSPRKPRAPTCKSKRSCSSPRSLLRSSATKTWSQTLAAFPKARYRPRPIPV